jgi:plastocyanin
MKRTAAHLLMAGAVSLLLTGCGKKEAEKPAEQPAAPAPAVNPETAGVITGKVTLSGTPPKMMIIRMGAEPACEKEHKQPVHAEDVVVGNDSALENVVVYIKSGLGNYSYPAPSEPAKLDQVGCMYVPHVVALMAGQQLEVLNSDPVTHNIHPLPKDNREWNESQPPNSSPIIKEFTRPELSIPVKCNIHPWMKAYICVFNHPYFAVTGTDGTFTIKNVPPGTYTVAAWQEKYGTQETQVTVSAKETKTVNFTFKAE